MGSISLGDRDIDGLLDLHFSMLSAVLTIVNNSYYILKGMSQFFGYILVGYHEYYKNYNVI